MKIGITGSTGLIGTALVRSLTASGEEVVRFVRRAPGPQERQWDGVRLAPDAVQDLDAVVHLAGAGVGDKRWSSAYKKVLVESRVPGTSAVARAVAEAGVPTLLSASAIGWYGDTGDTLLDESGRRGSGFLADLCRDWEAATAPADGKARVVHLRTGIVQSAAGGALAKQVPIFKACLGAPLGTGKQWVSWISLRDEVRAITHLLTADLAGPVNLVGPAPVTNRDYTKALGHALHRPTLPVPVPGFVLTAGLGEFAKQGVLTGQRLQPTALLRSGFAFQDSDLRSALESGLRGE